MLVFFTFTHSLKNLLTFDTIIPADMNRTQLENKVNWCRGLLDLSSVLDPGMSLLRGSLLFELQAGIVALAKHLLSNDIITNDGAKVSELENSSLKSYVRPGSC